MAVPQSILFSHISAVSLFINELLKIKLPVFVVVLLSVIRIGGSISVKKLLLTEFNVQFDCHVKVYITIYSQCDRSRLEMTIYLMYQEKLLWCATFGLNKLELLTQFMEPGWLRTKEWPGSSYGVAKDFVPSPLELYQLEKTHNESAIQYINKKCWKQCLLDSALNNSGCNLWVFLPLLPGWCRNVDGEPPG